ncbi:unnamed protein product [Rotaria magnacalcarata]|uniref:EF-hand domain-containing protein n=4 Tax=Rotaria magnacalcarata TaxID=392030 RepID=A0A818Z1U2_9BILA|nr:unnamed protein product [Rotaria magnacalcarata]CAF1958137.1 unnamed protein product [Rotaria magnacalcarata]CAF2133403.1 unnamed protein product [Rotaria magnacalcarata]CAF3742846.1 unnamed protein product [Rotaria magnacalcarata]CAF3758684.1 unnamed protein product [Rotaria magnacalcarata]
MASCDDNDTGFSESDIHFARETFFRDCPNGYCSKQQFLASIRKSVVHTSIQKSTLSKILLQTLVIRQNYRQIRKFFSMMFDIYDRNHDGQLDFNEYIYALSALTGANRLRTIETLYHFFDINNQGYITRHEFNSRKKLAAQFLGQYKTGINDHISYEQAFNTMDTNKDGQISKEEFIQWHLHDHLTSNGVKMMKKRTRILKNLSTLVDIRGQIKTSSLQHNDNNHNHNMSNKNPIDAWLETTINHNNAFDLSSVPSSPTSMKVDRSLLKVLRRARNRFIQHRRTSNDAITDIQQVTTDNQSDSGVFTSSSRTNFNDDFESNSLLDIDEDYLQSTNINDPENELLCQSLEAALMKTLLELKTYRKLQVNSCDVSIPVNDDDQVLITRL